MKWAAEHVTPGQIVLLRLVFGFLPILLFALVKRALRWEHVAPGHGRVLLRLCQGNGPPSLEYRRPAERRDPAVHLLCAWLFMSEERISMTKAAGVGLGFLGVLLIARPWSSVGAISGLGVIYMVAGSMSVGCCFVYPRRFIGPLKLPAVALATYQIGLAMVLLSVVTSFQGIQAVFADTRAWTGLIVGLGLFGTGLAYVIYYFIVEHLGAVAAACVTYIPPVVALVIGVFLVGDTIHPIGYAAMILILSGVAVLQLGSRQNVS